MKKETGIMNNHIKTAAGVLAIFIGLIIFLTSAAEGIHADTNYPTISCFEYANPVYEKNVDPGTAQELLGLPASLKAVCLSKADELDEATDMKTAETIDVPVIWEGAYDSNTPGEYILKARIEGYKFSGTKPTAVITVMPEGEPGADEAELGGLAAEDSNDYPRMPAELKSLSGINSYTDTIDLSYTKGKTGAGFTIFHPNPIYADYNPAWMYNILTNLGKLTFTASANGEAYKLIQTGVPNPGVGMPEKGPNYGTSAIGEIIIDDNVAVTLVISDIHLIDSITIGKNSKLTLLLDSTNYIRGHIVVPYNAAVTIDSLNGNDVSDCLIMPSESNSNGYYAKIGGPGGPLNSGGNDCGAVTIDGGRIDITARSIGAGIGGGDGGSGGTITITGGDISVIQHGSGGDVGNLNSGAGIGGGGGISNTIPGGDAGNLLISGGKVTVRQYSRSAGIGGGAFGPAGNITIEGGYIDVEVIKLSNTTGAGEGAAIGNGSGANQGTGNILISGGTVRAVSDMTGIGLVHGSENTALGITITGGDIYAKGNLGPGIGYWSASWGSKITILGGIVIAKSDTSTGIGGGSDSDAKFELDAAANVRAYSSGNKWPAINVQDNLGNGYYVNASLTAAISSSSDTTLNAFSEGTGELVKTMTLPAKYRHFAYSSDIDTPRTDNIYAQNGSAVIGTIVRVADDSRQIYSVKTRAGYNAHNGNANSGALPVKFAVGAYYSITEKYVDIYGAPIAGISDNIVVVSGGASYSKNIPAIDGYIIKGYKVGSTLPNGEGTYTEGTTVDISAVGANWIVHFVYAREFTITEKYVDVNGIDIGEPDTDTSVLSGQAYNQTIPTIDGYKVVGYFIGDSFDPPVDIYTLGTLVAINPVTDNLTVYFVYQSTTTLKISKMVTGTMVNKTTAFEFTIGFYEDPDGAAPMVGAFNYYMNGNQSGIADGALTLVGGTASFELKHGEYMVIEDVPLDCYIYIVETPDSLYDTCFKDSEEINLETGNDTANTSIHTGLRKMTENRQFDFTNERIDIPWTDFDEPENMPNIIVLALMIIAICLLIRVKYSLRKGF